MRNFTLLIITILVFVLGVDIHAKPININNMNAFISSYESNVKLLINNCVKNSAAWERLAYMCDTFGPRLSGTENLENSLAWIRKKMRQDGFDRVVTDTIMIPHWKRGHEYCKLTHPRNADIKMLGLGGSIATPPEGITAPVLVVESFDELAARKDEANGKIVVYNVQFESYRQCVKYRFVGAIKAAEAGAVASLARSVSPIGMNNPHTGMMIYNDTVPKIPHASILPEDAAMLGRMQKRGITPEIKLYMEAQTLPDVESSNVFCEIRGSEYPDEIIAVGGHIDSWDVGTGAHDDASGCIAAWEALRMIKESGLKPKRTLRAVMWANEENGQRGGKEYARMHNMENHILMFEFDSGVFPPSQIRYSGPDRLVEIVKSMEPLFRHVNDSINVVEGAWGVDIRPMVEQFGIPSMCLNTDDKGKYFWYHHSPADTPDKIKPEDFNQCIAAIAVAIYLYSELPGSFIHY